LSLSLSNSPALSTGILKYPGRFPGAMRLWPGIGNTSVYTIMPTAKLNDVNPGTYVSLRRRPPGSEQPVSLSSDLTVWLRWLMDGVLEIITGRERRRRWSTAEKLRIVEESTEHGAVMRAVAARNGVCESLLYAWRRQMRDGTLRESKTPAFVPVRVFEAPMNPMSSTRRNGRRPTARRYGQT